MMENKILSSLNRVATDYTSSKNLIKNINKRYKDTFKVVSCEESGCGYRLVTVLDIGNNTYKYKLYEKDNTVYFKNEKSRDNYNLDEVAQILRSGKNEIGLDTITIKLEDLTAEEYEIITKILRW